MTRACLFLAVALSIPPVSALAQDGELSGPLSRSPGISAGLTNQPLVIPSRWQEGQADPSPSDAPLPPPVAEGAVEDAADSGDKHGKYCDECEQWVCGDHCGPDVCRFDHCAHDGKCGCVTEEYCEHCCTGVDGQCRQDGKGWLCDGCGCDVLGKPNFGPELAFRFGWWSVEQDGDRVKVGEYQDLESSPFWDVDGIWTDGQRTLDFAMTGLDNEANDVRGYYYGGPDLTAKFRYNRFLRRWDHEPLTTFDLDSGAPGPTDNEVGQDLNVGEDYAIRVQQLSARFQGRLTQNLRWKVNVWGMRKSGERQANALGHCFDLDPSPGQQNNTCHVLSQRQAIDWTTMEIQPVLEARIGPAVVEYSRTMRGFGQSDQIVDRTYTRFDFSPASGTGGPPFVYAWVPENYTQVDRVKISTPLGDNNQFYGNLYHGNTENKFRGTDRNFSGIDLRVTNRAIDGLTLTTYAKVDTQNNALPTTFLTTPPFGTVTGRPTRSEPGSLRHPLEYTTSRYGVRGKYQPDPQHWMYIAGGYEYLYLARDFADYDTRLGPFTQPDTRSHRVNIGPYMRMGPNLNTFVRYRGIFTDDPLIGVRENSGRFNTNQPEQTHVVEVGGTWTPAPNFMATAMVGIENRWHDSIFAEFDEDNYPMNFTVWYAPTDRLSLTGGYAYFSNWIDQDITIGFRNTGPTETTRWSYGGENHLVSVGAIYACTPATRLVGGIEWNRGDNIFSVPPSPAGADWSLLPFLSDVIVETTRINMGVDHQLGPAMSSYFRYVHFDYEDQSVNFNSGTANMFLAGFTLLR